MASILSLLTNIFEGLIHDQFAEYTKQYLNCRKVHSA